MIPDHSIEILAGGHYNGNSSWDKKRSEIDNCFKIYQITEGELFLSNENREYLLQKNKLYFINGDQLSSQRCPNLFSASWLHFIPKDLIMHYGLLSMPFVVEIPLDSVGFIDSFRHVEKIFSNDTTSYNEFYPELLRVQVFIQTMIIRLFKEYPPDYSHNVSAIEMIKPAIEYIKQHYTETIGLLQLAECCRMSQSYFHKVFAQTLHVTPVSYITRMRMNAAITMLTNGKHNFKEIAFQLGYCNDAYFSRVFKKYFGITPGEYKKRRNEMFF